jgi:hypothetical protein
MRMRVIVWSRLESHSEGGSGSVPVAATSAVWDPPDLFSRLPKPVKSSLSKAHALEAFVATLALASAPPPMPLTEPVNPILQRSVSP